jgi:hypothetical protein
MLPKWLTPLPLHAVSLGEKWSFSETIGLTPATADVMRTALRTYLECVESANISLFFCQEKDLSRAFPLWDFLHIN